MPERNVWDVMSPYSKMPKFVSLIARRYATNRVPLRGGADCWGFSSQVDDEAVTYVCDAPVNSSVVGGIDLTNVSGFFVHR